MITLVRLMVKMRFLGENLTTLGDVAVATGKHGFIGDETVFKALALLGYNLYDADITKHTSTGINTWFIDGYDNDIKIEFIVHELSGDNTQRAALVTDIGYDELLTMPLAVDVELIDNALNYERRALASLVRLVNDCYETHEIDDLYAVDLAQVAMTYTAEQSIIFTDEYGTQIASLQML